MTNCHKNITSPCCTEVYTLARATRVVTLPCRHPGLRAIHNQMLPSLLQDRRALTVAPRAFNDNSLPVTRICIRFMKTTWPWPWSTHHVQPVLTQLKTGYLFRLTARHKGIENVKSPLYAKDTFSIPSSCIQIINARKMLRKSIITNATKE